MLNRLSIPGEDSGTPGATAYDIDQRPGLRLLALYACLLVTVGAIGIRLAYVQTQLGERYAGEFERTVEKRESIPSRDGRILTAEGQVLAEDVELFGIKAHYRWLEEPANPLWLKQQALSRLDRPSRRKPARVREETDKIQRQRETLWENLANLTGRDPAALRQIRQSIQSRVTHIHHSVEAARQTADDDRVEAPVAGSWWEHSWQNIHSALTTPPQRPRDEPLVVQEELDYHSILPEVTLAIAAEIESHPDRYPGLRIELSTRRRYLKGTLAPHLVGYRKEIDDDSLRARREKFPHGDPLDYRPGDRVGMTGLERFYERHLRGLRGERKLILNRNGEVISSEIVRRPRIGRDLMLTLNVGLQQAAGELLKEALETPTFDEKTGKPLPIPQGGSIVALDVRTGAILAAASAPGFDVNALVGHDPEAWRQLTADTRKPLFPRVTHMALPPGSTFKVLSAIAFLEQGVIDPEASFHCQGYLRTPDKYRCFTFRNFGVGHGDVNLVEALARSCNVYFFDAARRCDPTTLHEWAERFGFGSPTGVDLPGERGGTLPPPPEVTQRGRPRLSGDTLGMAIGQAQLTATPLQVARLMAAVANGGRLVIPRVVESTSTVGQELPVEEGSEDATLPNSDSQRVPDLHERTLHWVRLGLRRVIEDPHGTGHKTVRLPEISIAGKTGTAEAGGNRPDHAWFAGYVPAEQPRVAFVVVLEHAGSGGHAAGPVAKRLVQEMLRHDVLGVRRREVRASAN